MQQRYVYRTEKRDGIVRRRYVGTVDSVEVLEYLETLQRRRERQRELRAHGAFLDLIDAASDDLDELEREAMRERGFYRDSNSRKWRQCR